MDIGNRITTLRKRKGLTTNKLATVAGVSQSYLRDVELGNKNPTVEMLSYICDGLGVSLQTFFSEQLEEIEPCLQSALRSLSSEEQIKLAELVSLMKQS